jgi:hypothetical protein
LISPDDVLTADDLAVYLAQKAVDGAAYLASETV